jgi:hypothetical protein
MRPRWSVGIALGLSLLGTARASEAHGAAPPGPPPTASDLPPGPLKRLILDVQKRAEELGLKPEVVREPVGEALRAAERSRGARDAGDRVHGALLDKLAEQWAKAGQALVTAAKAERAASEAAARASELETKVTRAEALLAEQQARLGILQAEIAKAEEAAKQATQRALEKEEKRAQPKKPKKDAPR